jgi:hypothetical protein
MALPTPAAACDRWWWDGRNDVTAEITDEAGEPVLYCLFNHDEREQQIPKAE